MDDIVLRLAARRLKQHSHIKYIQKEVVKRTYGFDYERHFLPMIEAIIGRHGIEEMNSKVDNAIVSPFVAALASLKASRDQLAHQYIRGTTMIIDSPSVTNTRFRVVFEGLKNIEKVLLKR